MYRSMRGDQPVVSEAWWIVRASIAERNPNTSMSRLTLAVSVDEGQRLLAVRHDVEDPLEPGQLEHPAQPGVGVDDHEAPALALDATHRVGQGAEAGGVQERSPREIHDDPALAPLEAGPQPLLEGRRAPQVEVAGDCNEHGLLAEPLVGQGEGAAHAGDDLGTKGLLSRPLDHFQRIRLVRCGDGLNDRGPANPRSPSWP